MRRSRHTNQEIAFLLREAENGTAIAAICASARVSLGTFYRWRRRFGGLPPAGVARLEAVERENARLRAEVTVLHHALLAQARAAPPLVPRRAGPEALGLRPTPRFRGGDASGGRFAGVRTAN